MFKSTRREWITFKSNWTRDLLAASSFTTLLPYGTHPDHLHRKRSIDLFVNEFEIYTLVKLLYRRAPQSADRGTKQQTQQTREEVQYKSGSVIFTASLSFSV